MNKANAVIPMTITGMGHFHPEHTLDNAFFDRLDIGSSAAWIDEATGIQSRQSVLHPDDVIRLRRGEVTTHALRAQGKILPIADMAAGAWPLASERARLDSPGLDTMICGTSIPDYDIPANACVISARLGACCPSFDVNSACSSFVVNLAVARGLIASGASRAIAIANPERYSTRVDFTDRANCVLWGDGCAMSVVEATTSKPGLRVLDLVVQSSPESYQHVRMPVGEWFQQNGRAVQKFAVTRTVSITEEVCARNDMTPKDLRYFIGHQANLRMLESVIANLGLDPSRHLTNVATRGNQGGAGAPAVLSTHWDQFERGDRIAVAVVGAGLTWGAALLEKV
jgi:3-oxoacyl-[acyl-carrier-protein] synthase-3